MLHSAAKSEEIAMNNATKGWLRYLEEEVTWDPDNAGRRMIEAPDPDDPEVGVSCYVDPEKPVVTIEPCDED